MTATDAADVTIRRLTAITDREARGLGEVLADCVEAGASVSFMLPLSRERAAAFWSGQAADVAAGTRIVLVAEDAGGIVGTVQVIRASYENQPHRGDIAKMLVHTRARRRGIGAALMRAAETAAREAGLTLLVLDTASDDAERIYRRLGWTYAGTIPDFALWPAGGLCATHLFYRRLDPPHGDPD